MTTRRRPIRAAATTVLAVSLSMLAADVHADTTYKVVRGDSLWRIARAHSVTLDALLAANGLRVDSAIHPGQVLVIPTPTTTYKVRRGDGLRKIARAHGVSLDSLLAANGLRVDSVIHPGQVLVIPVGGTPPPTPPPTTPPPQPPATPPATPTVDPAALPREVRDRAHLAPLFTSAAAEAGVPADLMMAIGYHESRWRADAVSSAGALGVCQLMPRTAAWVARDLVGEPSLDPRRAADNIRLAAHLIRSHLDQAGGNLDMALAMYAQGVGGVERNGITPATRQFITRIAELRQRF